MTLDRCFFLLMKLFVHLLEAFNAVLIIKRGAGVFISPNDLKLTTYYCEAISCVFTRQVSYEAERLAFKSRTVARYITIGSYKTFISLSVKWGDDSNNIYYESLLCRSNEIMYIKDSYIVNVHRVCSKCQYILVTISVALTTVLQPVSLLPSEMKSGFFFWGW